MCVSECVSVSVCECVCVSVCVCVCVCTEGVCVFVVTMLTRPLITSPNMCSGHRGETVCGKCRLFTKWGSCSFHANYTPYSQEKILYSGAVPTHVYMHA